MNPQNPVWIHNLLYWKTYPYHLNHMGYPSAHFVRTLDSKIQYMGELIMASKAAKKPANSGWTQTEFVTIKLTGKAKDDFHTWASRKEADVALDVASFISNGHKIGISWDDSNKCWIVSATCKVDGDVNENCCITSRSDDWFEAMAMNVFKATVLCNGGAWRDQQESSEWG